ncbi:unnamed protein product [Vitrella brassicaformis CCMP3155]|uniref:Uncharacterized protein n=1 Tax=Vitrella brassicaformis (strain CCMP3155) TaxID=1169540 RepID=A0A0G4ERK2_VITBC|nr:unnamed protein product [Vitrella brassicaformis CCMP3155]|eukprot:CEM00037.1 unnamed protein product [Vitrella brassicaformis CCMP3155]
MRLPAARMRPPAASPRQDVPVLERPSLPGLLFDSDHDGGRRSVSRSTLSTSTEGGGEYPMQRFGRGVMPRKLTWDMESLFEDSRRGDDGLKRPPQPAQHKRAASPKKPPLTPREYLDTIMHDASSTSSSDGRSDDEERQTAPQLDSSSRHSLFQLDPDRHLALKQLFEEPLRVPLHWFAKKAAEGEQMAAIALLQLTSATGLRSTNVKTLGEHLARLLSSEKPEHIPIVPPQEDVSPRRRRAVGLTASSKFGKAPTVLFEAPKPKQEDEREAQRLLRFLELGLRGSCPPRNPPFEVTWPNVLDLILQEGLQREARAEATLGGDAVVRLTQLGGTFFKSHVSGAPPYASIEHSVRVAFPVRHHPTSFHVLTAAQDGIVTLWELRAFHSKGAPPTAEDTKSPAEDRQSDVVFELVPHGQLTLVPAFPSYSSLGASQYAREEKDKAQQREVQESLRLSAKMSDLVVRRRYSDSKPKVRDSLTGEAKRPSAAAVVSRGKKRPTDGHDEGPLRAKPRISRTFTSLSSVEKEDETVAARSAFDRFVTVLGVKRAYKSFKDSLTRIRARKQKGDLTAAERRRQKSLYTEHSHQCEMLDRINRLHGDIHGQLYRCKKDHMGVMREEPLDMHRPALAVFQHSKHIKLHPVHVLEPSDHMRHLQAKGITLPNDQRLEDVAAFLTAPSRASEFAKELDKWWQKVAARLELQEKVKPSPRSPRSPARRSPSRLSSPLPSSPRGRRSPSTFTPSSAVFSPLSPRSPAATKPPPARLHEAVMHMARPLSGRQSVSPLMLSRRMVLQWASKRKQAMGEAARGRGLSIHRGVEGHADGGETARRVTFGQDTSLLGVRRSAVGSTTGGEGLSMSFAAGAPRHSRLSVVRRQSARSPAATTHTTPGRPPSRMEQQSGGGVAPCGKEEQTERRSMFVTSMAADLVNKRVIVSLGDGHVAVYHPFRLFGRRAPSLQPTQVFRTLIDTAGQAKVSQSLDTVSTSSPPSHQPRRRDETSVSARLSMSAIPTVLHIPHAEEIPRPSQADHAAAAEVREAAGDEEKRGTGRQGRASMAVHGGKVSPEEEEENNNQTYAKPQEDPALQPFLDNVVIVGFERGRVASYRILTPQTAQTYQSRQPRPVSPSSRNKGCKQTWGPHRSSVGGRHVLTSWEELETPIIQMEEPIIRQHSLHNGAAVVAVAYRKHLGVFSAAADGSVAVVSPAFDPLWTLQLRQRDGTLFRLRSFDYSLFHDLVAVTDNRGELQLWAASTQAKIAESADPLASGPDRSSPGNSATVCLAFVGPLKHAHRTLLTVHERGVATLWNATTLDRLQSCTLPDLQSDLTNCMYDRNTGILVLFARTCTMWFMHEHDAIRTIPTTDPVAPSFATDGCPPVRIPAAINASTQIQLVAAQPTAAPSSADSSGMHAVSAPPDRHMRVRDTREMDEGERAAAGGVLPSETVSSSKCVSWRARQPEKTAVATSENLTVYPLNEQPGRGDAKVRDGTGEVLPLTIGSPTAHLAAMDVVGSGGKAVVLSVDSDGVAVVWDMLTGVPTVTYLLAGPTDPPITTVLCPPESSVFFVGDISGGIKAFSVFSGRCLRSFQLPALKSSTIQPPSSKALDTSSPLKRRTTRSVTSGSSGGRETDVGGDRDRQKGQTPQESGFVAVASITCSTSLQSTDSPWGFCVGCKDGSVIFCPSQWLEAEGVQPSSLKPCKTLRAHSATVSAVHSLKACVISGDTNNQLVVWQALSAPQPVQHISLASSLSSLASGGKDRSPAMATLFASAMEKAASPTKTRPTEAPSRRSTRAPSLAPGQGGRTKRFASLSRMALLPSSADEQAQMPLPCVTCEVTGDEIPLEHEIADIFAFAPVKATTLSPSLEPGAEHATKGPPSLARDKTPERVSRLSDESSPRSSQGRSSVIPHFDSPLSLLKKGMAAGGRDSRFSFMSFTKAVAECQRGRVPVPSSRRATERPMLSIVPEDTQRQDKDKVGEKVSLTATERLMLQAKTMQTDDHASSRKSSRVSVTIGQQHHGEHAFDMVRRFVGGQQLPGASGDKGGRGATFPGELCCVVLWRCGSLGVVKTGVTANTATADGASGRAGVVWRRTCCCPPQSLWAWDALTSTVLIVGLKGQASLWKGPEPQMARERSFQLPPPPCSPPLPQHAADAGQKRLLPVSGFAAGAKAQPSEEASLSSSYVAMSVVHIKRTRLFGVGYSNGWVQVVNSHGEVIAVVGAPPGTPVAERHKWPPESFMKDYLQRRGNQLWRAALQFRLKSGSSFSLGKRLAEVVSEAKIKRQEDGRRAREMKERRKLKRLSQAAQDKEASFAQPTTARPQPALPPPPPVMPQSLRDKNGRRRLSTAPSVGTVISAARRESKKRHLTTSIVAKIAKIAQASLGDEAVSRKGSRSGSRAGSRRGSISRAASMASVSSGSSDGDR